MRKTNFFIGAILLIISFSVISFSQEMKPLMQMDNSLLQAQTWLQNSLPKASAYATTHSASRIGDIRFEGCKMSYQQFNTSLFDVSGGLDNSQPLTERTTGLSVTVTLDLSQVDTKRMALKAFTFGSPLGGKADLQKILIYSINDKAGFRYAGGGKDVEMVKWGLKNGVTMLVQNALAQQVKENLMQAAMACQPAAN